MKQELKQHKRFCEKISLRACLYDDGNDYMNSEMLLPRESMNNSRS